MLYKIIFIFILISKLKADDLLIKTNNGYVMGTSYYINETLKINTWLGIPFAEKMIENLRFKRPVPVKNWSNILNATTSKLKCYQQTSSLSTVSEDCLYLNIWKQDNNNKEKLPVIIWIHGGGFTIGSATELDPTIFVAQTNLIFVSISYRLSIFGFLYLDHEDAPGNMGLLDQYLAIKWVYDNIEYFGGDRNKITIYGESAGAKSIGLHLVSKLTANYFRNAILSSGSPLADVVVTNKNEALNKNKNILKYFGCTSSVIAKQIECVRKIDPNDLLIKSNEYIQVNHISQSKLIFNNPTFSAVVDGYFLEDMPINLLNNGSFKKCPILTGVNKNEGNLLLGSVFDEFKTNIQPTFNYSTFSNLLTKYFYFYPKYPNISTSLIKNALLYRYTNWSDIENSKYLLENLDYAVGDYHYFSPSIEFINFYSRYELPVYLYYYTHLSQIYDHPEWWGVTHADELTFVFGKPLSNQTQYSYIDKQVSISIINIWNNFVRYNDPNDDDKYWPIYNMTRKAYINLSLEKKLEFNLKAEYSAFWIIYLRDLLNYENEIIVNHASSSLHQISFSILKILFIYLLIYYLVKN